MRYLCLLYAALFAFTSCSPVMADKYDDAANQWEKSGKPLMILFSKPGGTQIERERGVEFEQAYSICHIDVTCDFALCKLHRIAIPTSVPACWIYAPHHGHYKPHWHNQSRPDGPWFFLGTPGFKLIVK